MAFSWMGSVSGLVLGFIAAGGGWFGLVGAFVGSWFGSRLEQLVRADNESAESSLQDSKALDNAMETLFFESTFLCLGRITKADGRVTEAEIQWVQRVMDRMQLDAEAKRNAIILFERGKSDKSEAMAMLKQFRESSGRRGNLLNTFMEIQVQGALVDGLLDEHEWSALTDIAGAIGLPTDHLESMVRSAEAFRAFSQRKKYRREHPEQPNTEVTPLDEAYQLLGIDPDASDSDIKKAYRRMMSKYHPDKHESKVATDSMRETATERTQAIKDAFERIKQSKR